MKAYSVDTLNGTNVYALSAPVESYYGRSYEYVNVSRGSFLGHEETAVFGVLDGICTYDDLLIVSGHVLDGEILEILGYSL